MNPKRIFCPVMALLLIAQISCQFVTTLGEGTGNGYYTDPGDPIDVSVILDNVNVTKVISTEGGEISVTGTDGARYTLAIPAGALLVDTEIRMTPIASISNLPFSGGLGGAVKLEPSGLTFFDFVTLTIEPVNPIPLENQILFGFEEDGEDLHLAIPGVDSSQIQIRLLSFSGAGVASGASAEKAAVMQRMADRVEARLTNKVAEQLQKQNPDYDLIADTLREFFNSVVMPRLKAAATASSTCADGRKAMQTYLAWERQRQLLGQANADDNEFAEIVADYLPIFARKCLDEEFDRCVNQHMIAGLMYQLVALEREMQLLGISSTEGTSELWAYGADLARRCFQWDLEFASAGTAINPAGYHTFTRVKAKVPISLEGGIPPVRLGGKSALHNVEYTVETGPGCTVTTQRGGGEIIVSLLSWSVEARKDSDGDRFFVKDFTIPIFFGQTSETMNWACPGGSGTITQSMWNVIFMGAHMEEFPGQIVEIGPGVLSGTSAFIANGGMTYAATGWTVYEAELMATKKTEGTGPGVSERSEFRLIHRPEE